MNVARKFVIRLERSLMKGLISSMETEMSPAPRTAALIQRRSPAQRSVKTMFSPIRTAKCTAKRTAAGRRATAAAGRALTHQDPTPVLARPPLNPVSPKAGPAWRVIPGLAIGAQAEQAITGRAVQGAEAAVREDDARVSNRRRTGR